MSAPAAPMAPKARLSTPVAWYRTTIPTPDSAYAPPVASPITMYGLKNSQSTPNTANATLSIKPPGHSYLLAPCSRSLLGGVELELLLPDARLSDLRVDCLD